MKFIIHLDNDKYINCLELTTLNAGIQVPNDVFNSQYLTCYKYIDGQFIFDENKKQELENEEKKEILRQQREIFLKKFDIYKSNVAYGVITEIPARHSAILKWYKELLDITTTLNETPLIEAPEEILKY